MPKKKKKKKMKKARWVVGGVWCALRTRGRGGRGLRVTECRWLRVERGNVSLVLYRLRSHLLWHPDLVGVLAIWKMGVKKQRITKAVL